MESKHTEELPVVRVAVATIKTHPALQPRDQLLIKQREALRQDEQSERHVHDMAQLLAADPSIELAPLSIADVDGTLYVVDGHHRLRAYRRAKRAELPARVAKMTMIQASHASKLANVTHTKLEMLPAQKRNALWHHLAAIAPDGRLPQGVSQRSLQGLFGVSLDTVQRMLHRLPDVDRWNYPPEQCDGITRHPHWRFVAQTARNGMYQQMTPETRLQWKADKYAKRLMKLWEQFEPEAIELAHERLRQEVEGEPDGERLGGLEGAWGAAGDAYGPAF